MNALFKKELWDCLRWTPLAMALGLVIAWMNLPSQVYVATEMEEVLLSQFGLAAGLISIALGLLQSLPDARNDARGYLLHRNVPARQIFWAKIAAGFVAYMVSLSVPVLFMAAYLQWRGIETLPTNAWQLLPFLLYSLFVFLLHPTAIWIANRDARWVGTRLLPVVVVLASLMMLAMSIPQIGIGDAQRWMAWGAMLILVVGLVAGVLLAARHAFTIESQLPPASSPRRYRFSSSILLTLSSVILFGMVSVAIVESVPREFGNVSTHRLAMDRDGQWWQLQETRAHADWQQVRFARRPLEGEAEFQSVGFSWPGAPSTPLAANDFVHSLSQFQYLGSYASGTVQYGQVSLIEHSDRLLIYGSSRGLKGVLTPGGAQLQMLSQLGGSSGQTRYTPQSNPLLQDARGVYQLDLDQLSLRRLLDHPVDAIGLIFQSDEQPASLWTLRDQTLTRHIVRPLEADEPLPRVDDPTIPNTQTYSLPPITLEPSATYEVAALKKYENLHIVQAPGGKYALVRADQWTNRSSYRMLDGSEDAAMAVVDLPPNQHGYSERSAIGLCLPPLLTIPTAVTTHLSERPIPPTQRPTTLAMFGALHAVLAGLLAYWLVSRRGLSRRGRVVWVVVAALTGFGSLLAIIAIHPPLIQEACPRCSKKRRVDTETCEHCGQPWDPPQQEGIEILSRETATSALAGSAS